MKKFTLLFVSIFAICTISSAQAVLRITEVMSSGGTADWIEISNIGDANADITGYKIDDGSFSFATSLPLNGVTSIAAGESVIFGESGSATFATDFRTFWGIDASVQVGTYSGSGATTNSYLNWGTVKLILPELNKSCSVYMPIFDEGWWSVLITQTNSTHSLYVKNKLNYIHN
jgi:hypothetical protein